MPLANNSVAFLAQVEKKLAAAVAAQLKVRFPALEGRLVAGVDEAIIHTPNGGHGPGDYVNVGDNVPGDRVCWARIGADGERDFSVYFRTGEEDELVIQVFDDCRARIHMIRPIDGWDDDGDIEHAYGTVLRWLA